MTGENGWSAKAPSLMATDPRILRTNSRVLYHYRFYRIQTMPNYCSFRHLRGCSSVVLRSSLKNANLLRGRCLKSWLKIIS